MFFKWVKRGVLFVLIVFIVPALASLGVWQADASKPRSWRQANWSSAGILPAATAHKEAVIHLMAAKTGRWKGAFSVHSWIVMKREGAPRYDRYDVVGWGRPVRHNAYAADARWYSNYPEIIHTMRGKEAEQLIEKFEKAIGEYPASDYGDYQIWPGPNSNSFIAYLLNAVPEFGHVLSPNAVGRDWPVGNRWISLDPDRRNLQVTLAGYAGFAIGRRHGFEINFMGLVAGLDFNSPAVKLPGFGRIAF